MWRIAKQDRWKYAFLTFLFVILPFVNVTSSLDPELLPRTILIALFAFGFFGFAFRESFNVPDYYLFISLILGFWGIVVGTKNNWK